MGQISENWKKANIISIFKHEKGEDLENYRAIMLMFILVKVLEQISKQPVCVHLDRSATENKIQHEFVINKSRQSNLISF